MCMLPFPTIIRTQVSSECLVESDEGVGGDEGRLRCIFSFSFYFFDDEMLYK